jgi:hypothetical protein
MGNIKLEGIGVKPTNDKVTQQILLNISDESFLIHHSADMDILDVYLVLSAALDFIEDEAEAVSRREGSYLQ